MTRFSKLIENETGASAVEYGLIIAMIVLVMIAGLTNFADTTSTMWDGVSDSVTGSEDEAPAR